MPAKLVTYNSQNYASTLGSGLLYTVHTCIATYIVAMWMKRLYYYCQLLFVRTIIIMCTENNVKLKL